MKYLALTLEGNIIDLGYQENSFFANEDAQRIAKDRNETIILIDTKIAFKIIQLHIKNSI